MTRVKTKVKKVWGFEWPHVFLLGIKLHLTTIALIIIVARFTIQATGVTFTKYDLAKNGKITQAFVYDSIRAGGKGTVYYYYSYKIDERQFSNEAVNGDYKIGDSIAIIYLENNPNTSKPLKEIERDFLDQLKDNKHFTDFQEE